MLTQAVYDENSGQPVVNYPIQAGNDLNLFAKLFPNPELVRTPEGQLAPALEKQLLKLNIAV